MYAGNEIETASIRHDKAAAANAAEGFMDLAFARDLSVKAPFADKPYILELSLPAVGGGKARRIYADFRHHELMRLDGDHVIRECLDELNFVPALLRICRQSDSPA